tara:strand:- start:435 stop:926 length:492 start_codon:yes stop_codon:yes gene_type:complete
MTRRLKLKSRKNSSRIQLGGGFFDLLDSNIEFNIFGKNNSGWFSKLTEKFSGKKTLKNNVASGSVTSEPSKINQVKNSVITSKKPMNKLIGVHSKKPMNKLTSVPSKKPMNVLSKKHMNVLSNKPMSVPSKKPMNVLSKKFTFPPKGTTGGTRKRKQKKQKKN